MDTTIRAVSHINWTQQKAEILQINTMIYCLGDEADDIFKSFTFAKG